MSGTRLANRVVGGQPGVGERRDVRRLQPGVELHHRAHRRPQVLGHPAVDADAREAVVGAVHVVAGPAGPTEPAGHQRMEDDLVVDGDRRDRLPDRHDRAGVLVPDGVRQLDAALVRPLALDDVQVGAADAGRIDVDQDVERTFDVGSGTSSRLGGFSYSWTRTAFTQAPRGSDMAAVTSSAPRRSGEGRYRHSTSARIDTLLLSRGVV